MAYGISVLEFHSGKTHWTEGICPENYSKLIETTDEGDLYYRQFFFGQGKKLIINSTHLIDNSRLLIIIIIII